MGRVVEVQDRSAFREGMKRALTFSTSSRGYRPVVISDCVASMRGKDSHEMALELISRSIAWVLTVDEFKQKVLEGARSGVTVTVGS